MSARDLAKGGPVSAGTTETAGTGIMTIVIGVIVARTAEIVRGRASATITGATGIGAHGTVHHEVRRPPNNQQPCSPAATPPPNLHTSRPATDRSARSVLPRRPLAAASTPLGFALPATPFGLSGARVR